MASDPTGDNPQDEAKTVAIHIFSSHEIAKLTAANLEAHGIACWINADDCGGLYRKEFRAAGWQFGQSIINVVRCPCCPKSTKPNREPFHIKAALEEALGEDADGLATTCEDYDL